MNLPMTLIDFEQLIELNRKGQDETILNFDCHLPFLKRLAQKVDIDLAKRACKVLLNRVDLELLKQLVIA